MKKEQPSDSLKKISNHVIEYINSETLKTYTNKALSPYTIERIKKIKENIVKQINKKQSETIFYSQYIESKNIDDTINTNGNFTINETLTMKSSTTGQTESYIRVYTIDDTIKQIIANTLTEGYRPINKDSNNLELSNYVSNYICWRIEEFNKNQDSSGQPPLSQSTFNEMSEIHKDILEKINNNKIKEIFDKNKIDGTLTLNNDTTKLITSKLTKDKEILGNNSIKDKYSQNETKELKKLNEKLEQLSKTKDKTLALLITKNQQLLNEYKKAPRDSNTLELIRQHLTNLIQTAIDMANAGLLEREAGATLQKNKSNSTKNSTFNTDKKSLIQWKKDISKNIGELKSNIKKIKGTSTEALERITKIIKEGESIHIIGINKNDKFNKINELDEFNKISEFIISSKISSEIGILLKDILSISPNIINNSSILTVIRDKLNKEESEKKKQEKEAEEYFNKDVGTKQSVNKSKKNKNKKQKAKSKEQNEVKIKPSLEEWLLEKWRNELEKRHIKDAPKYTEIIEEYNTYNQEVNTNTNNQKLDETGKVSDIYQYS